jgi:hypothetical protein
MVPCDRRINSLAEAMSAWESLINWRLRSISTRLIVHTAGGAMSSGPLWGGLSFIVVSIVTTTAKRRRLHGMRGVVMQALTTRANRKGFFDI